MWKDLCIKGYAPLLTYIIHKEYSYLLNQYADDTEIGSKYSQNSLDVIIDSLDLFELQSGLKVNYDKTSIYRIGSLRNSQAKLYTAKPIAWNNDGFTLLGVFITNSDSLVQDNYSDTVVKARARLQTWSKQDLSLFGKIKIINCLVGSMFVHKMTVLPNMSSELVSVMESEFNRFIWNGKKAKIPYRQLERTTDEGGLKLVNLTAKEKALKITWIQILQNDPKCATLAYYMMSEDLKENILRCNFTSSDVEEICPRNRSPFWHDMLKAWAEINFSLPTAVNVYEQYVWFNSNIKVDGRICFWPSVYAKGLHWISQLYKEGVCVSSKEAFEIYGLDVMRYNSLISAIPKVWRAQLRKGSPENNVTRYDDHVRRSNLASYAYEEIVKKLYKEKPICAVKHWEKEFGSSVTISVFFRSCNELYAVTNYIKLRSFQYRLLNRALVLNTHLYRWNILADNQCSLCYSSKETLRHLFYDCELVYDIWRKVYNFIKSICQAEYELTYYNVIFNSIHKQKSHIANFIALVTKLYIYTKRCLKTELNFIELRNLVLRYKNIEKYIAECNGKISRYHKKWNPSVPNQRTVNIDEDVLDYISNM